VRIFRALNPAQQLHATEMNSGVLIEESNGPRNWSQSTQTVEEQFENEKKQNIFVLDGLEMLWA
jgi:hypothetical protein